MEPNHLTLSQTNWNKPGLFGKLVLWNRPRGISSLKTQVNVWFAVCLNQRNKIWTNNHIFPIASYCIESLCIESNRKRITLLRNRWIASLAASYVSFHWLCIEMRIASASVMEMHIPNIYIWRNDIPFSCFTYNKMNNILCYCGRSIVIVISVNSPLGLLSRLCLLCFHGLS